MCHTPIAKQLADISNRPLMVVYGHCQEHATIPAQGPQTILQIWFSYRYLVGFPLTHWRHHSKYVAVSLFFLLPPNLCFSSPSPKHIFYTFWSPCFSIAKSPRPCWLCQEWCSVYLAMASQPESLSIGGHRQLCPCIVCFPLEKHGGQPEWSHY